MWADHGLDYRYCQKWAEYHLRKSVEAFGVPKDLSAKRFRNFEASTASTQIAKRCAVSYTKEFGRDMSDAPGMLLVGAPGAGKTHLAIASLVALFVTGKIKTVSFRYVPKFLSDLRDALDDSALRRRLMNEACECDLLVLDDLGAERTSEWVREQLGIITNERWANRRATIVTSNDDLSYFAAALGPRAISRLESMLMTVPLQAPDRRTES